MKRGISQAVMTSLPFRWFNQLNTGHALHTHRACKPISSQMACWAGAMSAFVFLYYYVLLDSMMYSLRLVTDSPCTRSVWMILCRLKCWECGVKKKAPCGQTQRDDLPWCCHRRLGEWVALHTITRAEDAEKSITFQSQYHCRNGICK